MNALRLVLGFYFAAVLGVSGLAKLEWREYFAATLRRHQLLPAWSIGSVSRNFPFLEVLVAVMLVAGVAPIFTATVVVVLFSGFLVIEMLLLRIKRTDDCGCYGGAHPQRVEGPSLVAGAILVFLAVLHLWVVAQGTRADRRWRLGGGVLYFGIGGWLVWRMWGRRQRRRVTRQLSLTQPLQERPLDDKSPAAEYPVIGTSNILPPPVIHGAIENK